MKMLFAAVLMACVSVGRSNPRQLLRPPVIQCPIQDFVLGIRSPERSYSTYLWNSNYWVQTFHNISVLLQTGQLQKLQDAGPNCKDFTEVTGSQLMTNVKKWRIFNYIKC